MAQGLTENGTGFCNCTNPFCGENHLEDGWMLTHQDLVLADEEDPGLDDWEGPDGDGPGYTEYDPEAFDEMVRDDLAGRF